MADILSTLRNEADYARHVGRPMTASVFDEAADEIERLRDTVATGEAIVEDLRGLIRAMKQGDL